MILLFHLTHGGTGGAFLLVRGCLDNNHCARNVSSQNQNALSPILFYLQFSSIETNILNSALRLRQLMFLHAANCPFLYGLGKGHQKYTTNISPFCIKRIETNVSHFQEQTSKLQFLCTKDYTFLWSRLGASGCK